MSKLGILCLSGAFILFGGSAFAQTVNVDNNTNSSSQAGATAIAVGGGSDSPSKIKTTVPAFAPGLVAAGVHSCAGSTSAGVGATGWGRALAQHMKCVNATGAYAAALLGMGQNAAARPDLPQQGSQSIPECDGRLLPITGRCSPFSIGTTTNTTSTAFGVCFQRRASGNPRKLNRNDGITTNCQPQAYLFGKGTWLEFRSTARQRMRSAYNRRQ